HKSCSTWRIVVSALYGGPEQFPAPCLPKAGTYNDPRIDYRNRQTFLRPPPYLHFGSIFGHSVYIGILFVPFTFLGNFHRALAFSKSGDGTHMTEFFYAM